MRLQIKDKTRPIRSKQGAAADRVKRLNTEGKICPERRGLVTERQKCSLFVPE